MRSFDASGRAKVANSNSSYLTASQHKALKDLIHFVNDGPADGFASGAYREITYTGAFPSAVIWWESSAKLKKIVSVDITRNADVSPATETWKIFDSDGSTVLITLVDTINYTSGRESSRTRTWS